MSCTGFYLLYSNELLLLQILIEPLSTPQCVSELIQLGWEEAGRQVLQSQNLILTHALDRSRELIIFTDDTHHIRVSVNFFVLVFFLV